MQGFTIKDDEMFNGCDMPKYTIFDEIEVPKPAKVKEIRNAVNCSKCGIGSKEMRLISCPNCVGATVYGICNDCACMDLTAWREHIQNCGKTK